MFGILDNAAFARFEREEHDFPMPRKELPDHNIYVSRPISLTKSAPSLCDLSEARLGDLQNTDLVMPDVYRAPEVVLGLPWSYPVDIWGFAMTVRVIAWSESQDRASNCDRYQLNVVAVVGYL